MKKFSVFAWPAYANRAANPYNYILYNAIQKLGIPVKEFNFKPANLVKFCLAINFRVLHIHWPTDIIATPNRKKAAIKLGIFIAFIKTFKLFNKKIVWTVHNFQPHETPHPDLQKKLDAFLYKNIDGFISLNSGGLTQIEGKLTGKNQKLAYIPHMHYQGYYSDNTDKLSAQKKIGLTLPDDCFVFLFIGQIRTYKNVTGLIKAFKGITDKNIFLLIAGKAVNDLEAELIDEINGASNIRLFNEFVKDDELQLFLNAADLTVIPFSSIFNSGSAFLNFSFGKPVMVPEFGTFTEIQREVGRDFVKLYQGPINAAQLATVMNEVRTTSANHKPNITSFAPAEVARKTITFYNSLFTG